MCSHTVYRDTRSRNILCHVLLYVRTVDIYCELWAFQFQGYKLCLLSLQNYNKIFNNLEQSFHCSINTNYCLGFVTRKRPISSR